MPTTHKVVPVMLMQQGKGTWHCFEAMGRFADILPAMGHKAICISDYNLDTALFSNLSQKARERHCLYHRENTPEPNDENDRFARYLDCVTAKGCAGHDAQNALR